MTELPCTLEELDEAFDGWTRARFAKDDAYAAYNQAAVRLVAALKSRGIRDVTL